MSNETEFLYRISLNRGNFLLKAAMLPHFEEMLPRFDPRFPLFEGMFLPFEGKLPRNDGNFLRKDPHYHQNEAMMYPFEGIEDDLCPLVQSRHCWLTKPSGSIFRKSWVRCGWFRIFYGLMVRKIKVVVINNIWRKYYIFAYIVGGYTQGRIAGDFLSACRESPEIVFYSYHELIKYEFSR